MTACWSAGAVEAVPFDVLDAVAVALPVEPDEVERRLRGRIGEL